MKLSFVIPCYNSEKTIENVVKEIKEQVNSKKDYSYEIILINDNSKDNVWKIIQNMASEDSQIKGISFAKNFGQHSALMAGYRVVTGDIIVSLDDDGQTPVNEVFSLIDELNKGYDVVFAQYDSKKHSLFRNFGTKVNNLMCEILLNKPKNLVITSYFVAKRFIIDEIINYTNSYTYVSGLILRTTDNISTVQVNHRERQFGRSGYNLKKLLTLWFNGFTAFSIKPLRISVVTGVLLSLIGFVYLIFIIINKLINPAVPMGWSSIISIIVLIGGIILLMLGMIGEYIGRIYICINNSPQYVIKDMIKNNCNTENR